MKKYIIRYDGLFEHGHVKMTYRARKKTVPCNWEESKQNATQFSFKKIAAFWCLLLNKTSNDLKTFTVVMYED